MDKIWAPWLASCVSAECSAGPNDIDLLLAGFDMPVEGWHSSVAEILSSRGYLFEEEWPSTDRELAAWLGMRPHLESTETHRTAGLALIRASDGSICLTLGGGRVAESWGGGLAVNYNPPASRYARTYELPYVVYLRSRRNAVV